VYIRNLSPLASEEHIRTTFGDCDDIVTVTFKLFPGSTTQRYCQVDFKTAGGVTKASALNNEPLLGVPMSITVIEPVTLPVAVPGIGALPSLPANANPQQVAAYHAQALLAQRVGGQPPPPPGPPPPTTAAGGVGVNITGSLGGVPVARPFMEPESAQIARTIHVDNLPMETTEDDLKGVFGLMGTVTALRVIQPPDKDGDKKFALIEYKDRSQAEQAFKLNGYQMRGRKIKLSPSKTTVHPREPLNVSFDVPINNPVPVAYQQLQKIRLEEKMQKVRAAQENLVKKLAEKDAARREEENVRREDRNRRGNNRSRSGSSRSRSSSRSSSVGRRRRPSRDRDRQRYRDRDRERDRRYRDSDRRRYDEAPSWYLKGRGYHDRGRRRRDRDRDVDDDWRDKDRDRDRDRDRSRDRYRGRRSPSHDDEDRDRDRERGRDKERRRRDVNEDDDHGDVGEREGNVKTRTKHDKRDDERGGGGGESEKAPQRAKDEMDYSPERVSAYMDLYPPTGPESRPAAKKDKKRPPKDQDNEDRDRDIDDNDDDRPHKTSRDRSRDDRRHGEAKVNGRERDRDRGDEDDDDDRRRHKRDKSHRGDKRRRDDSDQDDNRDRRRADTRRHYEDDDDDDDDDRDRQRKRHAR